MERQSFIVFSDDYGEHPSSCQHLFRVISKEHYVLWVNTIGMRKMRLNYADCKKAFRKILKMVRGDEKVAKINSIKGDKIKVIQPLMLPFVNIEIIRKFNAKSVIRTVRRKLKNDCIDGPILVTTVPNSCDYVGSFNEKKIVYYCVDDFSNWPGLEHNLVRIMEGKLIDKADCFFATSVNLFDRLKSFGKPTELLAHGVDIEQFRNLPKQEHSLLTGIPRPRVGCYGLFDERNDQELLFDIASKLKDISFVFTGEVVTNNFILNKLPNVFFTGPVPYQHLPSLVTGLDVLILAYKDSEVVTSINPLKLKEYLATGIPIVCSPIKELMSLQEIINIAKTPVEWEKCITANIGNAPRLNMKINKYIEKESWEVKANEMLSKILEC